MKAASVAVEVCVKSLFHRDHQDLVKRNIEQFVRTSKVQKITGPTYIYARDLSQTQLANLVDFILLEPVGVTDAECGVVLATASLSIHLFELDKSGRQGEYMEGESEVQVAQQYLIPSADFHGLWEHLLFDRDIKGRLLNYVNTAMMLADKKVDANIVSYNRLLLLHGPPGTGKTSLCRALCHKLAIRLSHKFKRGLLMEIQSQSLFSKWYSESGRMVQKLFDGIQEVVQDADTLLCLMIDEVESISAMRRWSSSEPTDSVRVVNALLTQMDSLKQYPNVLILTTSNVTGVIDPAFLDRADIKCYIGHPSAATIQLWLKSMVEELLQKEVLTLPDKEHHNPQLMDSSMSDVAQKCVGLSMRAVSKLPLLALSEMSDAANGPVCLNRFWDSLRCCIQKVEVDLSEMAL